MRAVTDELLYAIWHVGQIPGVIFTAIICALPPVLVASWVSDPRPPAEEIRARAQGRSSGRIVGVRINETGSAIFTLHDDCGRNDEVVLSGIVIPMATRSSAISWIMHNVSSSERVDVYEMTRRDGHRLASVHVVSRNVWTNGTLVEAGLARVLRPSECASATACRRHLQQLQDEAMYHRRGIWAR